MAAAGIEKSGAIQQAGNRIMNVLRIVAICLVTLTTAQMPGFAQQPATEAAVRDSKQRLKKVRLGSINKVTAFGDIYLAGQPSQQDLAILRAKGIKTIICLRHPKELNWDEAVATEHAGMKYVHAPFGGAQQLTPEVFEKVINVLRDKRSGPTILHCGAANRVGAIWYAYRVLDGKLTPAEAEKEAKEVGLRTPAYLEKAKEYVKGVQAGTIELKKLPPVEP